MTVKAIMPARSLNLVSPLPHEGTDVRTADTHRSGDARSGAISQLIGDRLRPGDVDSEHRRSSLATTPGTRTSTTATRTTTTRASRAECEPSADSTPSGAPFTFEELVQAWLDCRCTKRNSASALAFEQHVERNLGDLHDELLAGTYQPGRSICFVVRRPKIREVWAADFRDRVVHHLLYNRIAPAFHAGFIAGSCACIPGRGTLYAATRLAHDVRSITQNWTRPAWYLKCDLANFFVAIDKTVLFELLCRRVHTPWWRELTRTILFHDPRADVEVRSPPSLMARVPPHKSLFNAPADTGLPIGNLSSQFFANVFLDALDQFAKHQVGARRYVRYVDDFVLLHESPQWLNAAHARLAAFLPARLRAHLNPAKTILQPVDRGIDFVGHLIRPWSHTTRPRTVRQALHRIEDMPAAEVYAAGNSYLGLVRQAAQSHQDQVVIARALLKRGHAVDGGLTRIFRTAADRAAALPAILPPK